MTSPSAINFSLTSPRLSTATRPTRKSSTMTPNSALRSMYSRGRLSAFTPVKPVLTPAASHTPSGSQAHVLLSPSRTLTESLTTLASLTAQELEGVWDEVGYTPQDRAAQLSELLVQLRDLCQAKISEELGVAETFRSTIGESKEELRTLSAALKAPVDQELLRESSQVTLMDQLAMLESTLEGLREQAETAKKDLRDCREVIVDAHVALGIDMNEQWNNVDNDLTATRREQFREKADEMKEELASRSTAVIQLLRDCQHLMNDLNIDGMKGTALERQIAGSLVRSKDGSFMMTSKYETETCTGISSKAIDSLTKHAAELGREKKRRKNRLQEMGAEIALLWEQLHVSEDDQRAFTESVKGLGMDTIEKGEQELERLRSLKSDMLSSLVEEARSTIRTLWEETNASQEIRDSFTAMNVTTEDGIDDAVLDAHEEYIRKLQERFVQMKPILRLIERREGIIRERIEYEELQKDSDRLQQRGAAMAQQLMREEKMAKRIKRELPKLTQFIVEKLKEWKDTHEEPFFYRGKPYEETMKEQDDEWAEYKTAAMEHKLKKLQEKAGHGVDGEENVGRSMGSRKKGAKPLGASDESNKRSTSRARPRDGSVPPKPNQARDGSIPPRPRRAFGHTSRYSNHV